MMKMKLPELSRSQRLLCMLTLTGSYFVVELVVGVTTNSLALVADSFHMASDVLALVVALVAIRIGRCDSTPRYSYGFQRAELIGALANGVFLLGLCFTIAVDAIVRIIRPEVIERPKLVFIVGLVGLAVNLLGLLLFSGAGHVHHGHTHCHSHAHAHAHAHDEEQSHKPGMEKEKKAEEKQSIETGIGKGVDFDATYDRTHETQGSVDCEHDDGAHHHLGHEGNVKDSNGHLHEASEEASDEESAVKERRRVKNSSLNMRAVLFHVAGDALGSLVVVFTAIAIWKGNSSFCEKYLDPIASLIIVFILGYASLPLVLQASSVLLNAAPPSLDTEALHDAVTALPGVLGVHELHVWQLSDLKLVASAHIRVSRCCSFMMVGSEVKEVFHAAGVHSVTLQPEFVSAETAAAAMVAPLSTEESGIVAGPGSSVLTSDTDCLLRCTGAACEQMMCCPTPLQAVRVDQAQSSESTDAPEMDGSDRC